MVHKCFRPAQEECMRWDFVELPDNQLAAEMACLSVVPSGWNDNPLKVGETRFQPFQLAIENDVLLRCAR